MLLAIADSGSRFVEPHLQRLAGVSDPTRCRPRAVDLVPIEQRSLRPHVAVALRACRPGPGATACCIRFSPRVCMGRDPVHLSPGGPQLVVCRTLCRHARLWLHLSHGILQLLFVPGSVPLVSRDLLGWPLANSRPSRTAPDRRLDRSSVPSRVGRRHGCIHHSGKQHSSQAGGSCSCCSD